MRILYIEPFDGGSHQRFGDALLTHVDAQWTALRLPGRHWKWRMRGSASYLASNHQAELRAEHDLIFCSSFLPLAELYGLVPEIANTPSILYFHENQLAYPTREEHTSERDHHYGFTQIISAQAATRCLFNSQFNLQSFVDEARKLLRRMPDLRVASVVDTIESKSQVVPLIVDLPSIDGSAGLHEPDQGPVILWNHRWEHDKNPDGFLDALLHLKAQDIKFRLIVCGESFAQTPSAFSSIKTHFPNELVHFGTVADRAAYLDLLGTADIVVSTAQHEFFGIAVLEATHAGAYPLVPNALAYPELYPSEHRFDDPDDLHQKLEALCRRYSDGERLRADRSAITKRSGSEAAAAFAAVFREVAGLHRRVLHNRPA